MLRILTYHRVAEPARTSELDPVLVSASPDVFRAQMLHVRRWYRPVAMSDVLNAFHRRTPLPPRAVHVTFDDAYRDFGEVAWPILRELGIPVTVFVPTAYPDVPGRAFWWDRLHRAAQNGGGGRTRRAWWARSHDASRDVASPRVRAVLRAMPHDELERYVDSVCLGSESAANCAARSPAVHGWEELRALAREGVTFGAHTRHHVGLSYVDEARARAEIRDSLSDIARQLPTQPRTLAYPYGAYNEGVARIAREEGCALALTCEDGLSDPGRTDPMRVRRTNITRRTSPPIFSLRMLPWFAYLDRLRHSGRRHLSTALPA